MTMVPWIVCLMSYSLLHLTYPEDLKQIQAKEALEEKKDKMSTELLHSFEERLEEALRGENKDSLSLRGGGKQQPDLAYGAV